MMWSVLRVAAIVIAPAQRSASGLSDLTTIDQLKTRFKDDQGSPRLILLLSPT